MENPIEQIDDPGDAVESVMSAILCVMQARLGRKVVLTSQAELDNMATESVSKDDFDTALGRLLIEKLIRRTDKGDYCLTVPGLSVASSIQAAVNAEMLGQN
jgi:hypothetical protein